MKFGPPKIEHRFEFFDCYSKSGAGR